MNNCISKVLMTCALTFVVGSAMAQGEGFPHKTATKEAKSFAKGKWINKFGGLPDASVDVQEFYEQYQLDSVQFEKGFHWLATHDLQNIAKGKYPIEGTNLFVSVEDSENKPLKERSSESHYKHVDFQYVVKGTEGFRLLNHATSKPNCNYDIKRDVIHYNFVEDDLKTLESKPGKFMLFMPSDWHIAKVATKKADQNLRVVVIKFTYHDPADKASK